MDVPAQQGFRRSVTAPENRPLSVNLTYLHSSSRPTRQVSAMAISEATAPRCGWQRNDRPGRRWCSMHRCRSANCWHGYASLWSIGCRRPVDGWRSLWRARWGVHVYSVGRRQVYGLAQIVGAVHPTSAPPSPRYTCPPPPRLVRILKEQSPKAAVQSVPEALEELGRVAKSAENYSLAR